MRRSIVLVAALVCMGQAFAQPIPDTLWTRTYGEGGNSGASSVQQTTDGGYVIAGWIHSLGTGYDYYVIKTNSQGDTLWTHTYGGSNDDWATAIQQTADGGYVIAGGTASFGAGGNDIYVVKTNTDGDTLWTRTYGGSGSDGASSIQQTADSGFVIAGANFNTDGEGSDNFYVVRTDSHGDTLWTRTYGGSGRMHHDVAEDAQQTADGGFVITGWTDSFGAGLTDFYVVKTNAQGDTLWTQTYGGSNDDLALAIRQTTDGGYVIAGETKSFGAGSWDAYVLKTNAQGDTLWTRTYGGSGAEAAHSIQQTTDGGYVIAGSTNSFGAGEDDYYVVRTNTYGDTLWTRTYGGSNLDDAYSIQLTTDGGYFIAGETGDFGGIWSEMYVVKTGPDMSNATPDKKSAIPAAFALEPNYPNPFNPTTQIAYALPRAGRVSLTVSNLLGQKVATLVNGTQPAGTHTVAFNGSSLPSGVYLCGMRAGDFVQTKKMMLLK